MGDYWFKPKAYGFGAYPTTWQGWALIPAFMLAIHAAMWPWLLQPALAGEHPTTAGLIATFALISVAVAGFLWLCKTKTDGEWAWRWGENNQKKT